MTGGPQPGSSVPPIGPGGPARRLIAAAVRLAQRARSVVEAPAALRQPAALQVERLNLAELQRRLRAEPIAVLRELAGPGARLKQLEEAGFGSVDAVLRAAPGSLLAVDGVGPQTVDQVLRAARAAAEQVSNDIRFRFDVDSPDPAQTRLLASVAAIAAADRAVGRLGPSLRAYLDQTGPLIAAAGPARSRLKLLVARRARRDQAVAALARLDAVLRDPRVVALERELAEVGPALDPSRYRPDDLWRAYASDAASVNALLSTVHRGAGGAGDEASRGYLPEDLGHRVARVDLDTSLLTSTLRGYQAFGAQYVLQRGRAMLGDEMGLGKTMQALAVCCHLAAQGERWFLVICPASVQMNWLAEVAKHTRLSAVSLHGEDRDEAAARWLQQGGVAVTTFGTLDRLPAAVRGPEIALVIVDEAHYVKNPEAVRSRAVAAATGQAPRALLLTGTPMENRVEEFRTLVRYLDPVVAARVGAIDALGGARSFRRAVAEVYLRRNADDVLDELPERIEVDDWVLHTPEDEQAYAASVRSGNLMAMRQAAFAAAQSAKLERLDDIVAEASEDGMKVVIFSYFLGVLATIAQRLGPSVVGTITGAVPPAGRQGLIDAFSRTDGHAVLLSQIEAGGVGINVQAASVVILTEPQWKPSTEEQAIARAHRMGQIRSVQVHRLLARHSVDERIREVQAEKALLFDEFARQSDAKDADRQAVDTSPHRPSELDDAGVSLQRRVVLAEEYRLGLRPELDADLR